jgi:hypothetical protein
MLSMPRIVPYSILILILLILGMNINSQPIKIKKLSEKYSILMILGFATIFILYIIFLYGINLNLDVLFFQNIYLVRHINSAKGDFLSNYFYNWLDGVILPVILIYGLIKKNKLLIIISILTFLYLFITFAHKSTFFSIFIILILFFFKDFYKKILLLLSFFLLLFIICRIITVTSNKQLPESIVVRRTFFDPALSNIYYFDYFKNTHTYLSNSFLNNFIQYPFAKTPEQLIAINYFKSPNGSANNGLISDAYMNFGNIGIPIWILMFSILFSFINRLNVDSRFFGVFFISILTFIYGFFFSALLTHGFILLILLSIFCLKKDTYN